MRPVVRGFLTVLALPVHTVVLGMLALATAVLRRDPSAVVGWGRPWSRLILAMAGVRLRVQGRERSDGGPFVVLANHQSLFDIPALAVALERDFCMVAKRELFHIPVFGWALQAAQFIPVNRARRDQAIASLSGGTDRLRAGRWVVMFPEGTRSRDGHLQPLKKGAFHLAAAAGVPLLPITLSGSRAVLPRQGWIPRSGIIDVVVGEPLPPPRVGEVTEAALAMAAAALRRGYTPRHHLDLETPSTRPPSKRATEEEQWPAS